MITQTDTFVPLVASSPSDPQREFKVTVIPQAGQPQAFHPVGSAGEGQGAFPKKQNCEPQLSVQREGDKITNIRIQCRCGQTIDVACVYDKHARAS